MEIEKYTMVPAAIEEAFRHLNGAGPLGAFAQGQWTKEAREPE